MKYDVTIGIPVYLVERYIQKSLESALSQSYPSIEYLIVDDCGEDNSIQIVRQMKEHSSRGDDIRIVTQPMNLGVAAARNRIIDEAQGEFIFFMDSDDVINTNAIFLLMQCVRLYDAEVAFGSYEKVELSGERVAYGYPKKLFLETDAFANFCYRKFAGIQASACNYLVRSSLLKKNNHRFINANYWEDYAFTFDLVPYVSRAVTLPDVTYIYICRENSLSHYQHRAYVNKSEIMNNIRVIDHLKTTSSFLTEKTYYPNRCLCIMMTDFYIACNILKRRSDITPSFSNDEIRILFRHPSSFWKIMSFRQSRIKNVCLYLLGRLPSYLCVFVVWCIGKIKKLV